MTERPAPWERSWTVAEDASARPAPWERDWSAESAPAETGPMSASFGIRDDAVQPDIGERAYAAAGNAALATRRFWRGDAADRGVTRSEAALRGGAQGLTFGHFDELRGFNDAHMGALRDVGETITDGDWRRLALLPLTSLRRYRAGVDEEREALDRAREAHPVTAGVSEAAGSIVPIVATGGAAAGSRAAAEASRRAGMVASRRALANGASRDVARAAARRAMRSARMRSVGRTAAAEGAIYGHGVGEGSSAERLPSIAAGAVMGRAAPRALQVATWPIRAPINAATRALGARALARAGNGRAAARLDNDVPAETSFFTRVREMDRAGVPPSIAAASGGTVTTGGSNAGRLTRAISQIPFVGNMTRSRLVRQYESAANAARTVADDISPARTADEAGASVRSGLEGARASFDARRNELYERAFDNVNPTTAASLRNTLDAIENVFHERGLGVVREAGGRRSFEFSAPRGQRLRMSPQLRRLQSFYNDFAPSRNGARTRTATDFRELRQLRTAIREIQSNRMVTQPGSQDDRALAMIYQAMTRDMLNATRTSATQTARRTGIDPARMVRVADRYTRRNTEAMRSLRPFENDNPSAVYGRILGAAREGKGGNLPLLRRLMATVGPEARNDVAATALREMGAIQPGAQGGVVSRTEFSIGNFVRRYNAMDERARRILFGERFADLERLNGALAQIRAVERMADFSNVTAIGSSLAFAGGAVAHPVTTAIFGAAGAYLGRALMSPRFARTAARVVEGLARVDSLSSRYGAAELADVANRMSARELRDLKTLFQMARTFGGTEPTGAPAGLLATEPARGSIALLSEQTGPQRTDARSANR